MKKLFIFWMLLLSSTFLCHAQDLGLKTKLGPIFKDEKKNTRLTKVIENGDGEVVIIRSYYGGLIGRTMRGYYIEYYNQNLELIREFDYNFSDMEMKDGDPTLDFIVDGDKLHIIEFYYDKAKSSYVISANSANVNTFKFERKQLATVPYKDITNTGFFGSRGDGDNGALLIESEDKSAFLIAIDLNQGKNQETHQLYLFDKSLNLKIDYTFTKDIKDRNFNVSQFEVSEDGSTLYLLGKVSTKETKAKEEGGKYMYELIRIDSKGLKSKVFDSNDKYASSLKTVLFNNRLVCVGFYSEKSDKRYKGVCYFDIDPSTLKINTEKYNPFSEQFMIDKYGKNKNKELRYLSFRSIITTDKNEIIFNAEESFTTEHTYFRPNGGTSQVTNYHKNDIICVKLSTTGDLQWSRNINKAEVSIDYFDPYA